MEYMAAKMDDQISGAISENELLRSRPGIEIELLERSIDFLKKSDACLNAGFSNLIDDLRDAIRIKNEVLKD